VYAALVMLTVAACISPTVAGEGVGFPGQDTHMGVESSEYVSLTWI